MVKGEKLKGEQVHGPTDLAPMGPDQAFRLRLSPALFLLFLLLFTLQPLQAQSAPPKKLAESLARIFGQSTQVDTLKVDSSSVLRISSNGSVQGFATVRNVKGKDQQITFLVAIDPANTLKDIDVLVYREPYGGEVAYESWRKQFRGKSSVDALTVGKDIKNISGATISSHSVTLGVRKALADLTAWHQAGRIK
jgi:Na+-translocating ferredoxin:NAD+ oxidoreductase RnfG subunit